MHVSSSIMLPTPPSPPVSVLSPLEDIVEEEEYDREALLEEVKVYIAHTSAPSSCSEVLY